MTIEKVHEINSIKQSKWLEKFIIFIRQKRNKAKNNFQKDFYKLLVNAAFVKFLDFIRNRLQLEFIKKEEYKELRKRQSKLTFNGIHKSYENCGSSTFKNKKL